MSLKVMMKVSRNRKSLKVNKAAFEKAVDEVTKATQKLLGVPVTK